MMDERVDQVLSWIAGFIVGAIATVLVAAAIWPLSPKKFVQVFADKPFCLTDTATVADKTVELKRCWIAQEVSE